MFDPSKLNIWNKNKKVEFEEEKKLDIKEDIQILDDKLENQESKKQDDLSNLNTKNIINNIDPLSSLDNINDNGNIFVPIKEEKIVEKEVIYDININSLFDLLKISIRGKYDSIVLEPNNEKLKIIFLKDKLEKELKYIKLHTYYEISIQAKEQAKLKVSNFKEPQNGKAIIKIDEKNLEIFIKSSYWELWEKLIINISEKESENKTNKEIKKIETSKIIGFLMYAVFSILIVVAAFLWFILFNSNTVQDLIFLQKFWIDIGVIKDFLKITLGLVFWLIIFIETILLAIFSFKWFLTKKIEKKKKIVNFLISIFLFFILIFSMTLWAFLDNKVFQLKWADYSEISIYDNDKYVNWYDNYIINTEKNLIWPVTVRVNIENFINKFTKEDKNEITSILWKLWKEEREWKLEEYSEIITFDRLWIYQMQLVINYLDIKKEKQEKIIDIGAINIKYLIDIKKTIKEDKSFDLSLNAESLKDLWKIRWYQFTKKQLDDNSEIKLSAENLYEFISKKPIQEETLIWIEILDKWDNEKEIKFDKIFVFKVEENNLIEWEIKEEVNLENDKLYSFYVDNIITEEWMWYISDFFWELDDWITYSKIWDSWNQSESSRIEHEFKDYWKHKIKVSLWTYWKQKLKKILIKEIFIKGKVLLKNQLIISEEWQEIKDINYKKDINEYIIKKIWVPTNIELNAEDIESNNSQMYLDKVEWDTNWDWKFDKIWKKISVKLETDKLYNIKVRYSFRHVNDKIKDVKVDLIENIIIRTEEKEAQIDFNILPKSDYAPTTVTFDASNSKVKWKDIIKFIYNYWDNTWDDETWAKNMAHLYEKEWTYNITLTVITRDGQKYSKQKVLSLLPVQQTAKIWTSMLYSRKNEYINFDSYKSNWEIEDLTWYFWDWEISNEKNPVHEFKKSWTYKVVLEIVFKNKNILKDEVEIVISE